MRTIKNRFQLVVVPVRQHYTVRLSRVTPVVWHIVWLMSASGLSAASQMRVRWIQEANSSFSSCYKAVLIIRYSFKLHAAALRF